MPASIHTFAVIFILLLSPIITTAETTFPNFTEPPHNYWQQEPHDLFTKIKSDLGSGRLKFDTSSEKAFVTGILKALDIPVSSQLLVFSTTSLQLRLINYRNPRALYFNEEIYLGWVPNGKIEVISIDPNIGGVFHIFNIPRTQEPPTIARSTR